MFIIPYSGIWLGFALILAIIFGPYLCMYVRVPSGVILETDIDFQDSLLPKKKAYMQEVGELFVF